jgi:hypothetical protein
VGHCGHLVCHPVQKNDGRGIQPQPHTQPELRSNTMNVLSKEMLKLLANPVGKWPDENPEIRHLRILFYGRLGIHLELDIQTSFQRQVMEKESQSMLGKKILSYKTFMEWLDAHHQRETCNTTYADRHLSEKFQKYKHTVLDGTCPSNLDGAVECFMRSIRGDPFQMKTRDTKRRNPQVSKMCRVLHSLNVQHLCSLFIGCHFRCEISWPVQPRYTNWPRRRNENRAFETSDRSAQNLHWRIWL